MKYKVKYWISVDFLAEEIIEADDFNAQSFSAYASTVIVRFSGSTTMTSRF